MQDRGIWEEVRSRAFVWLGSALGEMNLSVAGKEEVPLLGHFHLVASSHFVAVVVIHQRHPYLVLEIVLGTTVITCLALCSASGSLFHPATRLLDIASAQRSVLIM